MKIERATEGRLGKGAIEYRFAESESQTGWLEICLDKEKSLLIFFGEHKMRLRRWLRDAEDDNLIQFYRIVEDED